MNHDANMQNRKILCANLAAANNAHDAAIRAAHIAHDLATDAAYAAYDTAKAFADAST